jgi:hypothetical protein
VIGDADAKEDGVGEGKPGEELAFVAQPGVFERGTVHVEMTNGERG